MDQNNSEYGHFLRSVWLDYGQIWSENPGPHFSRIRTENEEIFSPNVGKCRKNEDQNNSEYGNFLRSDN